MLEYYHYLELAAFVTGIACYKKKWPLHYKLLFFLTGLTCLVEITARVLAQKYGNNNWLYNLFSPIECLVVLYFFSRVIIRKKLKQLVSYCIPLVLVSTLITYLVNPHFTIYNNYAHTTYLILWIISCGLFFIDVMINHNRVSLIKQPGFWLATGIFFFSVIFVTIISLYNLFPTLPDYKRIFSYFIIVANTFMYVGFAAAYLCHHITTRYYSRSSQQA